MTVFPCHGFVSEQVPAFAESETKVEPAMPNSRLIDSRKKHWQTTRPSSLLLSPEPTPVSTGSSEFFVALTWLVKVGGWVEQNDINGMKIPFPPRYQESTCSFRASNCQPRGWMSVEEPLPFLYILCCLHLYWLEYLDTIGISTTRGVARFKIQWAHKAQPSKFSLFHLY